MNYKESIYIKVKVCDCIMGTGKSSAAITYMNEHPNQKFIYITPYLDEAARIKKGCSKLRFVEPCGKIGEYHFHKAEHTGALIKEGRNIASTHQAFKNYTKEMLEDIRSQQYTLIIDENVDILDESTTNREDMGVLVEAGYLKFEDGKFLPTGKEYKGRDYDWLFSSFNQKCLADVKSSRDGETFLYWTLSPELITSFENTFVLTYLFEGQSLKYYFQMHGIEYEYIGVEHSDDGKFRFSDSGNYTPEYVSKLKDMIHILDKERLNRIGDDKYALSVNWFNKGSSDVKQLKNNIYNYFINISRDTPVEKRMWSTFKTAQYKIRGKGYTKAYLAFNARATNEYKEKDCLAYAVNIFMNTSEKLVYKTNGIDVDEDKYALSIMLQWIWRSAIRDGKEINLYIPSKRMRDLLINWMDEVSGKGNVYNEEVR